MNLVISGKARSGKDTVATLLVDIFKENGIEFKTIAYADKLKAFLGEFFSLSFEQLYGLEKEFPDYRYPKDDGTFWTSRELMQFIGTDVFRKIDPDFWVKIVRKQIKEFPSNYFITDGRFDNEIEWVIESDGLYIDVQRFNRDKIINSKHESEKALNNVLKPDIIINNNFSNVKELKKYLKIKVVPLITYKLFNKI